MKSLTLFSVIPFLLATFLAAVMEVRGAELSPEELRQIEIEKIFGNPNDPSKNKEKAVWDDAVHYMQPFSVASKYTNKGHIGIHQGDTVNGPLLGYLACHKLVEFKKDAVLYGFTVHGPLMEITALATDDRMAIASGTLGPNLSADSKNFHFARHTRFSSPAGSGLQHDKEQAVLYQTTIFSYDPDDEEIEAQWVNNNGDYVDALIALMNNRIFYTGDVREFKAYANAKVERVTFKWYPSGNH